MNFSSRQEQSHVIPHVQGLRAIAVLSVVLYHFWPGRLGGGYVGVDIFFVISGFLITSHVVRELTSTGTVRLGRFWARRARRLLPASLLVLLFCVVVATMSYLTPISALPNQLREIIASTFYVQNWYLAISSVDYLAQTGDPTTVQHYWSLSLEEQFYVLWPLILLLSGWLAVKWFRGARLKIAVITIGVVTAASFVFCVVYTIMNPGPAYFVTFARMWQFGVGALITLVPALRVRNVVVSFLLGGAGIAALLYSIYFFDAQTPFPGYMAVIPTLGTAAVLAVSNIDRWWYPTRLLSFRPLRFIGDISYSLYLWHWPLIVIAPSVPFWGLSIYHRVALLILCFVLAWLTKRFVEDPVRSWRAPTMRLPRVVLGMSLAAMVLVVATAGAGWVLNASLYQRDAEALAEVRADPPKCFGAQSVLDPSCTGQQRDGILPSPGFAGADRPDDRECFVQLNDSRPISCRFGSHEADAPRVVLIGDSHAFQFLNAFKTMAEREGWALITYFKGACPWNTTPLSDGNAFGAACTDWRKNVGTQLENRRFDVVFTAALSTTSYSSAGYDSAYDAAIAGYRDMWSRMIARGTPVVTMVDIPVWKADPNKCLRTQDPGTCWGARDEVLRADDSVRAAASEMPGVTLLDFTSVFCDAEVCYPVVGGANVYRDEDHLTVTFTYTLVPQLTEALKVRIGR